MNTGDKRQKCEIRTRCMGYHRPVSQFNKGKKCEFYSRTAFSEDSCNKEFNNYYTQ